MKFNRRLIAASTAVALSVTALVAPAAGAAEASPNQSSISAGTELSSNLGSSIDTGVAYADKASDSETTPDKDKDEKTGSSFGDLFRDKDGKVDPSKITAWIGVITAVIGALSTVMSQMGIRL